MITLKDIKRKIEELEDEHNKDREYDEFVYLKLFSDGSGEFTTSDLDENSLTGIIEFHSWEEFERSVNVEKEKSR